MCRLSLVYRATPRDPLALAGAGPDEIIEASRTGKGQFYHYFRSKEGLVHEVLQTYLSEIKTGTSQVNYEINSWRDLEKWFLAHVELQNHYEMTRGCPFGTLGNEVTENDELIRQDVSLIFEVVKNKLAAILHERESEGTPCQEGQRG